MIEYVFHSLTVGTPSAEGSHPLREQLPRDVSDLFGGQRPRVHRKKDDEVWLRLGELGWPVPQMLQFCEIEIALESFFSPEKLGFSPSR